MHAAQTVVAMTAIIVINVNIVAVAVLVVRNASKILASVAQNAVIILVIAHPNDFLPIWNSYEESPVNSS